jgi:hypothetical protein
MPKEPLTDRNVNQLAVVAFAAAAAPATRSVYYVTRTDGAVRGSYQKLVVRLDSLLHVADVVPIDVHPQHMAYLGSRNALIVANADSEWFECRMP